MNDIATSISADNEIYNCLDLDNPKSFFLFAGAGSGKTRSLVEVLKQFRINNISRLKRNAQKVGVITYTNAACDEIKRRLEFDSAFHVSTIHSFAWELIKPFTADIKKWLKNSLESDIIDLNAQQSKAKSTNTKTYVDRASKIESKNKRLNSLNEIRKFIYNPDGDNTSKDSLNHSEVIYIAAEFIQNKPLMQSVLTRKYPILLIDESQDTKKELIDAFLVVQKKNNESFTIGMFGDTMQRIYTDGKIDLGKNLPETWAKPSKEINYRCPKRIIALINKIRSATDGHKQSEFKSNDGVVRFFLVDTKHSVDKVKIESEVSSRMSTFTGDTKWNEPQSDVKILTLEHHMAARRGGFSAFFDPLYSVDKLKTGLLDGSLSGASLFISQIFPLINAKRADDQFAVAKIVRRWSPLFRKEAFQSSLSSDKVIIKANDAVNSLFAHWDNNANPSLNLILREVYRSGLFQIPDALIPIAKRLDSIEDVAIQESDDKTDIDIIIDAWEEALKCPFSQFEEYVKYISDESRFGTHQGIKGLEFPRVMVILDDEEARGFLFSYEKLFGAKEPTATDIKNKSEGNETSIERTRRLFYVTCSRAEESLAIVAYTKEPEKVKKYVLTENWFENNEVIDL